MRFKIVYINKAGRAMTTLRWAHSPLEAMKTMAKQHMWTYEETIAGDTYSSGNFIKQNGKLFCTATCVKVTSSPSRRFDLSGDPLESMIA